MMTRVAQANRQQPEDAPVIVQMLLLQSDKLQDSYKTTPRNNCDDPGLTN
jgi:hypothetical protein